MLGFFAAFLMRCLRHKDTQRRLLVLGTCLACLPIQVSAELPEFTRADAFILIRERPITPEALGAPGRVGLGIADPSAAMVLMDPPIANNQGTAQLTYPLEIPAGRAGVQPDLLLAYGSDSGNGQSGLGWRLSVGEITIDTRWGVPRYLPDEESETYLLDGDQLAPTAVRSVRLPRQPDRVFTRRVEGPFERIRRMGVRPGEYWWEVTDKFGTRRFYGGTPEAGRDPAAILATDDGKGFAWALKQIRDKSENTATFYYQVIAGEGVGEDELTLGRDIYLDRIEYTGTMLSCDDYVGADAPRPDCDIAPYEIDIVRASELDEPRRGDVQIDAMGGFLRVTSDLIRRVDVRFLGDLERRYELDYATGAFAKTLLTSIGQAGADGAVWARHNFEYYDDARLNGSGSYRGFDTETVIWDTRADQVRGAVGKVDEIHDFASALGGVESTTVAADAYVGFNPAVPLKNGSVGIGAQNSQGISASLLELLDINGDALPDKMFRTSLFEAKYRLNQSGPAGGTEFSGIETASGLPALSREITSTFSVGGEVYLGLNALLHRGAHLSTGQAYFLDVNADMRPDYINGGLVLFNSGGSNGQSFTPFSAQTPVPIDASNASADVLPDLSELEQEQRENSPLIDTLRRWRAPWDGTIRIEGDVTLIPPLEGEVAGDGVRVAIQHEGTELWSATIPNGEFAPRTPGGVDGIPVHRGDDIYFRLQSRDDGASDHVIWNPLVRYIDVPAAQDVNGLPVHEFRAARDFTLGGHSGSVTIASLDGTVRVAGPLRKTAKTTDDVTIQVFKNGGLVAAVPVGRGEVGDVPFQIDFDVLAPRGENLETTDKILLRLKTDSPVDLAKLSWTPLVYYVAASQDGEPVPVTDEDGNPNNVIHAPVDYQMYPANSLTEPQQPWTAPWDHEVYADPTIQFKLLPDHDRTGSVVLTIKKKITGQAQGDPPGTLIAKKTLRFVDGNLQNSDPTVKFNVTEGAEYWFDFSAADPAFAADWRNASVKLRWDKDGLSKASPHAARHWTYIPDDVFPMAYRGWGVAGYDGNGARAAQPLDESRLVFDEDDYSEDQENPNQPKAFVFTPFVGEISPGVPVHEWRGPKSSIFASAVAAGSSRKGADSVRLFVTDSAEGSIGGIMFRPPRFSVSPQWSAVGGFGGLVGLSAGWGPGLGMLDMIDMNGDQFPDIVGGRLIQYTTPRGGLEPGLVGVCSNWVRKDSSITVSGGLDISLPSVDADAKGQSNTSQKSRPKSGQKGKGGTGKGNSGAAGDAGLSDEWSAGVTGSLGRSWTNVALELFPDDIPFDDLIGEVKDYFDVCIPQGSLNILEQDMADINGDGLPDRIRVSRGGKLSVNFNLGYGFDDRSVPWPGNRFESGFTDSVSVGGGVVIPPRAFAVGVSGSWARTRQRYSWVDLNGDGLLDQLINNYGIEDIIKGSAKDEPIMVRFGTGAGLTEATVWLNFQRPGGIQEVSSNLSVGIEGGALFTVGIGPLCVAACYVIVGAGGSVGKSVSRQTIGLLDVNGDGYPDHVTSDKDDQMVVALNRIGRTNLLHRVNNPLGGRFLIDYERQGNTMEQPFSQWVMSELVVEDGHPGDGADRQHTTFTYEGNRYHHLEREILGYARVGELHHDTTGENPSVLRSVVRDYRNETLFDKGLMERSSLLGPGGKPFTVSSNAWSFTDVSTQQELDLDPEASGLALLDKAVFPRLTRTVQAWFSNNQEVRRTSWEFGYDHLGNVVQVRDFGELGAFDDTVVELTYSDCRNSSWVNLPRIIEVRLVNSGDLLRRRRAEQLCNNNSPTALWEDFGDGESHTVMDYDFYGNYGHIIYPSNSKGQRYEVNYSYDYPRYTDVAHVVDSFGMEATARYEGLFGAMTTRTDPNGQTARYDYDAQGRLAAIVAPYEQGTGNKTVVFEYHTSPSAHHSALARNYDALNPADTIDTAAFVDGLGRVVQTQHDATVLRSIDQPTVDVTVVSGALEFDALGRVVKEWYPTEASKDSLGIFQPSRDGVAPTVTAWNFFDEKTRSEQPNGAVYTFDFDFYAAAAGASVMLVKTATDPLGNVSRTFTDTAGYVNFVEQDVELGGAGVTLQTALDWDPLDQLVGVTDPEGNETVYVYDLMGRRVSTNTPDGGLVEYTFDAASQLVARVTPRQRATGERIEYGYDFNRLVSIDYPDDTPDVHYEYGDVSGPALQIGRIVRRDDGARIEEQEYGRMGEVVKETDTMLAHNAKKKKLEPLTWTLSWAFDSWGRPYRMTYPDGEVVSYAFDAAGRIASLVGQDAGNSYPYVIRQAYDKFGERRYQETGNGVATETEYYADSRRLQRHKTVGPERDVQDINYVYDLVGNVTSIVNAAPPPVPSRMGGTSRHQYRYDELYRLVSGEGAYEFGSGKTREYRYDLVFDVLGNIEHKSQSDAILNANGKANPQRGTTYSQEYQYGKSPHQATRIGNRTYDYDSSGNRLGWQDLGNGSRRTITWDAENRMTSASDQGSLTDYRYNSENQLALQRGPQGETLFVNRYYTVRNGTVAWKNIWAGEDQVATKREKAGEVYENQQFLLHKDLRGNVRIVTDRDGRIYEYLEYFPGGEGWIVEKSDTERVPYRYISAYFDEDRMLYHLGARWYDPREQLFYSPDPALEDSLDLLVDMPTLQAAYTYADNNPLRYVDREGRAPTEAGGFANRGGPALNLAFPDVANVSTGAFSVPVPLANFAPATLNVPAVFSSFGRKSKAQPSLAPTPYPNTAVPEQSASSSRRIRFFGKRRGN